MHCPYCGKQISDTANVCGYCGSSLHQPEPPPPPPPAQQPTQVIIQSTSSGGLFSSLTGLLNFALAALVAALIVFIVLVYFCVIRLPSSFPIVDLPSQMDVLWSRAVAMQGQICGGGQTDTYQPQNQSDPAPPKKNDPAPIVCNSGLDEVECKAAGGNQTMICDMEEGCHTICFCGK